MTSLVPWRARRDVWAHYAEQREGNIVVEPTSLAHFLRPLVAVIDHFDFDFIFAVNRTLEMHRRYPQLYVSSVLSYWHTEPNFYIVDDAVDYAIRRYAEPIVPPLRMSRIEQ